MVVRGRARVLMVLPVLALAAACGGSDDESQDSPTVETTSGAGAQSSAPVQHPTQLVAEVGENDEYQISLTDGNGKAITNLAAGSYKILVHDYSGIHNFHLTGSGVGESTSVGEKKTATWNVTFKPGTYTFVCDPHASSMRGTFTVS